MSWKKLLLSAGMVALLAAIDQIILYWSRVQHPLAHGTLGVLVIFVLKFVQKALAERKERENW